MPARHGLRALKQWRYVGVFGPQLMLCLGTVRVGPARQSFWAIWDRPAARLHERTTFGRGPARIGSGGASLRERSMELELELRWEETPGIETVCASGEAYAWTRKQGGVRTRGTLLMDGVSRPVEGMAIIDDTAAYYPRHTHWRWSAGVGTAADGRALAWNLVAGVNDPPRGSERTVWVDGRAVEAPPSTFAHDLSSVDGLCFSAEATRERRENLLVIRSRYRQPFGTFAGELPGGIVLAEGFGVMEEHEVWW